VAKPLAEANEWLEKYREYWESSFAQLDTVLEELKARNKPRRQRR
jgi:hypothetical protein